ncbi:transcription factor TFIIIB subunit brf1 [Podila horticola]|nr:transcription factor TFIIIB subunit brf1 [Podila horticola]
MACPHCGGNSIEYDAGQGNATCTSCGAVLEENTIVAEISFSESGGGAASVVGTFVAEGRAGARSSGPGRRQTSQESREKTLDAARRRITAMAVALKLNEHHAEVAQRYFNLALNNNFIQGRRSEHVVACCLYIVCRMEKTTHMLIDFSELLSLNVFKLGVTFLHLTKQLNLTLPLVDPSLYISRFATMLDFGEDTQRVANDALRLVSRMDRDWIRTGRRPAGVCGACLLIAARMHHYRRSQKEIIQVVKIGESTLRKRLDEFAATPSGQLTVSDFRELWLEDAADPPAFAKSKKRSQWDLDFDEDEQDEVNQEIIRRGNKKQKIQLQGVKEGIDEEVGHMETQTTSGELVSMINSIGSTTAEAQKEPEAAKDRKLEEPEEGSEAAEGEEAEEEEEEEGEDDALEEEMDEEMRAALDNPLIREEEERLDAEEAARKLIPFEPLDDVDDDEIENVILNEEEVKIKTQVWMELNKEYLQEQEEKRARIEMEKKMGIYNTKKGRKKGKKQQQPPSSSAAEAGKSILEPKLPRQKSKKINYSALDTMDDLFDTDPTYHGEGSPAPIKSVFEEPTLVASPIASRQSSVAPSTRAPRLSSISRIAKSSGASSVKFSTTPTGSRTVSREQSMQARSIRSGSQDASQPMEEEDDEIIAPPKSRTRAEREADAAMAEAAAAGGEEVVEAYEEEEVEVANSFAARMGYSQYQEEDYGGEYDDYNDYDD